MGDDLEERLKSHARAFEGLMSLIPADKYYGKDASITSTQWQKTKKQSREERQAAKRAKLDPASHKSAQDVLDENARKRKRELEGSDGSSDLDFDVEKEKPLEGLKPAKPKKQKMAKDSDPVPTSNRQKPGDDTVELPRAKAKADKKKQKLEKKKEKLVKKKQEQVTRKAKQNELSTGLEKAQKAKDEGDEADAVSADDEETEEDEDEEDEVDGDRIQPIDVSGLTEEGQSTSTPSATNSNASTGSVVSAASSSSSLIPPSAEDIPLKRESKPFKYDPEKHLAFKSRLTAKLDAMRAARKADGPDGRPARNRAELIEARRKKEADRKSAKKASRQLAKEDEQRLEAEEQLARLRGGSGSPSLFQMQSPPENERNFAFGKVAWDDGRQLDSNLSGFLESRKKKGKSDPKTALEAAEKKKARVSGLDEAKRKDIQEKDMWLTAKKRAQGEKVHDDTNLLKKTLKRQEKAKQKSKPGWKDRLTSVATSKYMKQKKQDENLKKRREEKGSKGKKVKKPGKKVKKRPGFEGTFKGK